MAEEKNELVVSEQSLPWLKMSDKAVKAVQLSRSVHRAKHGLFANIPIVCQGPVCPYGETCMALGNDIAPEGEPCPVEIAQILELYEKYSEELQVDTKQMVNLSLLKSLIDAEVTISRCEAILAKDANIIQELVTSVLPNGRVIKNPAPHIALDIKAKAIKQKNEALQLLNSTPKDKAKQGAINIIDASTYASRIRAEAERLKREQEKIIDVTPEEETKHENRKDNN